MRRDFFGAAAFSLLAAPVSGQVIVVDYDAPTADRWNYPFNGSPGIRAIASSFSAADQGPGFDDRDAQFLLRFETMNEITPGLDPSEYQIIALRVRATIDNGGQVVYDDTPDSFRTLLDPMDPEFLADSDAGAPIEIYGVGYRNGFDVQTWTETSAFGGVPVKGLAQGNRHVFAANFDEMGNATDISNFVKERFETVSFGVGVIDSLSPGDVIGDDTEIVFDIPACDETTRSYLQQALSDGTMMLTISSMALASGGPGGGMGEVVYPVFKARENALGALFGQIPGLELTVRVGSAANFDQVGGVDFNDVISFLTAFSAQDPAADLDPGCVFDFNDVVAFLVAFGDATGG